MTEELKSHIETAHVLPIKMEEQRAKTVEAEAKKREADAKVIDAEAKKIHEQTQQIIARQSNAQEVDDEISATATSETRSSSQAPRSIHDKRDSLPHPSISENASVLDWSFFLAQWRRYISATKLTTEQQIHHLWAAYSPQLQRALHCGNAGSITDPRSLLEDIRLLAVKRKNNLVHVVELQRMGEASDETITQFSTRLNGQAAICDLPVECPECQYEVSFREKAVLYQFIRGLADSHSQDRILEALAQVEGGELSLIRVLKLAEAFEMAKTNQQLVNAGGQLSRLSEYQAKKRSTRQDSRPAKDTKKDTKKCGNCRKGDHTSKLNDRRKNCPAFDQTCTKCQVNGHFASECRGTSRNSRSKSKDNTKENKSKVNEVKAEDKETDPGEIGTMSGSWMLINGQDTSSGGDIYEVSDVFTSVTSSVQPHNRREPPTLSAINSNQNTRKLRHHIADAFGKWRPGNVQPHGRIQLNAVTSKSAQQQLQLPPLQHTNSTTVQALADTGAQMCVADWQVAKRMNIRKADLLTPALTVSVADNANLELMGAQFVTLSSNSGQVTEQSTLQKE